MINNITHTLIDYPQLIKEWDYDKNTISPNEVTSKSAKKVWWKCSRRHSWEAIIYSRSANNTNCPYCSGKIVIPGENDLATLYPNILKEWDFNKNTIKPNTIKAQSHTKVWWKCSEGHSWKAIIANRTDKHQGCPICYKNNLKSKKSHKKT